MKVDPREGKAYGKRMPKGGRTLRLLNDAEKFVGDSLQSVENRCRNGLGQLVVNKEDAQAIAALVKSLDLIAERKRIIKGQPLPGSYRPQKPNRKANPTLAFPVISGEQAVEEAGSALASAPAV